LSFIVEIEGYRARVERDRDGILHGRVLEMEDQVYFKAPTVRMVEAKFANALQSYFEMCKQKGIEPRKPNAAAF
jgi:predicted HicB family RNase H-like nuclease